MMVRFAAVLIVLFWMTMTALLIRNEVSPELSGVRVVPMSNVLKLLYQREQPSDLIIYDDAMRVGNLRLHPTNRLEDKARLLEFTGTIHLRLPGPRRRLSWNGLFEMDSLFTMDRFSLEVTVHEPSDLTGKLEVVTREKRAHFTLLVNGSEQEHEEFTLDEAGVAKVIAKLGGDPEILKTVRGQTAGFRPEITARRSSLKILNEETETFLIVVQQSGQTLLECHLDQVGKVIRARTAIGYTLAPSGVTP